MLVLGGLGDHLQVERVHSCCLLTSNSQLGLDCCCAQKKEITQKKTSPWTTTKPTASLVVSKTTLTSGLTEFVFPLP